MAPLARIRAYLAKHELSQKDFGKKIGVSQGMVHQWLVGLRPIGAERAVEIEKKTGGEICRHELRPDIFHS